MKKISILVSLFLLPGFIFISNAQPGSLDNTFGNGGIVIAPDEPSIDRGQAILLQSDGKIIVAGYSELRGTQLFSATRYLPDGSLDVSFGNNGLATIDGGTDSDQIWAAALQADGKILMAGSVYNQFSTYDDFALVRLNTDGSPDNSFGNAGLVITDLEGFWDNAYSVAVQTDGKIVVGGQAFAGSNRAFCIMRHLADGTLDNSFGTGGIVTTDIGSDEDKLRGICLQDDGKILACGYSENVSEDDIAIVRYNVDGTLDNSFGSGGILVFGEGSIDERAWDIMQTPDGKILVCGFIIDNGELQILLAQLESNGTLDPSFGNNGISIPDFNNETGMAITLQEDGKILVTGGSFHFSLSRYLPDGSADTSFGDNGIVVNSPGEAYSFSSDVIVQPDGKILVGGYADNGDGSDYDFAAQRYHAEGTGGMMETNNVFGATSLYPNPASSMLYCNLPKNTLQSNLILFDVFGREISNTQIPAGQNQALLDVSTYPTGVYFVVLRSEGKVLGQGKLVVR